MRHGIASIRQNPFSNAEEADILSSEDWVGVVGRSLEWIKVQYYPASRPPQSTGEAAARQSTGLPLGWVHQANLLILGRHLTTRPWSAARVALPGVAATRRFLRLQSWVTGLFLRTGASQAFAAYRLLTDTSVWYEVVGQTETAPVWYRIQYDATFQGWVHSAYVELGERVIPIPAATPPALPAEPGPGGETGSGTVATSGSAAGDFRNLVTNPDGRWAVWKSGTQVTANFSSPRSPVQWYARQNPQPQFVLPGGFRPTGTVTQTVTGTRVNEDRTPVPNAPAATFDLRIETDGEMRYVDNSKVDHLGFVSYSVTHLRWQTDEALVVPSGPAQPGDIAQSGVYLNQQVNWGSSWDLARTGNAVSGSFGSTRSPVEYYANDDSRAAQLLLPDDYRPTANVRFQVTGAVRVNEDGTDSPDARRVNFWITVQPNGEMWYDEDASLETQGVGFVRYTANVAWTAAPRITVPGCHGSWRRTTWRPRRWNWTGAVRPPMGAPGLMNIALRSTATDAGARRRTGSAARATRWRIWTPTRATAGGRGRTTVRAGRSRARRLR